MAFNGILNIAMEAMARRNRCVFDDLPIYLLKNVIFYSYVK